MGFVSGIASQVYDGLSHLFNYFTTTNHVYEGDAKICFSSSFSKGLSVTIDTQRLHIQSVQPNEIEYERYAKLFGDAIVMQKYAAGQTKSKEDMQKRIETSWAPRWSAQDPYAGLAVLNKETGEFMGHVVLGHGDLPGESEIAYLFHEKFWGQGYGSEAVSALVSEYAPATIREGYLLEGKPLEKVTCTVRLDNPASVRIAEKVGMIFVKSEEKYGAERHFYEKKLSGIQANFSLLGFLGSQVTKISGVFSQAMQCLHAQYKRFQ